MPVTLNHTIVPAADHRAAARFLATVMGLAELPPAGRNGHFAPVRVNETLTLDFMAVPDTEGHHLAFDVDPATFDGILARLRAADVPYGSRPDQPDNGRTDHPLCARGLFFTDADGNLYEVMSPA
ncbi:metallothiol transferase FosB [Streptomyces noursei ZPM]|uniref:ChaP protein n=1 Tax=Streptomyces noursei TaxID=1971 RepID=A0A401R5C3_STRNR|nr:VOC family protein [Streptomyces noursei]AKA05350.1 metallothiol transferase FosB [Streptomyces noursei ZPM]EOT04541.1 metallothiol transferase FosB [Streptomyces noursei CCRC 11814]EXU87820.1 metallothiol transferase FosB [Streptomyces noursei PD-1]UWS73749.1 VOC family protein [Streptomyces noursei]GCB92827.1 chaP protein [Streptomyces noursei]